MHLRSEFLVMKYFFGHLCLYTFWNAIIYVSLVNFSHSCFWQFFWWYLVYFDLHFHFCMNLVVRIDFSNKILWESMISDNWPIKVNVNGEKNNFKLTLLSSSYSVVINYFLIFHNALKTKQKLLKRLSASSKKLTFWNRLINFFTI